MPSIADHTPEHTELAGLYALGSLDGDELETFRAHLDRCAACRTTVEQDRRTLARLTAATPEMEPSPGFRERLLARAADEMQSRALDAELVPEPGPAPIAIRARAPRRRPWALLLAAALSLALALGALLTQQAFSRQVVARTELAARDGQPGTATVIVRRTGDAELAMQGLPEPPPGQVYEAWVIGADGRPLPAGTGTRGTGTITLQRPVRGATVALTLEAAPGRDTPSSEPIRLGVVG